MRKRQVLYKLSLAVGIVFCIFFGLILICNVINCINRVIRPDKPPVIFGIIPMVVQSGSMSGDAADSIDVGDLIFVMETDMEKMQTGDIIAFYYDNVIVSHRIIDIKTADDGSLYFYTKGDANNTAEDDPVTNENFIGVVRGRIPHLGNIIMFLQEPLGFLLCGVLPFAIILSVSVFLGKRKKKCEKANDETGDKLE